MSPKRAFSLISTTTSTTTSSYKHRFLLGFLRALRAINRQKPSSPSLPLSSPREICKRYLKVKKAADASMASAVGSARAWSRALLRRTRRMAGRDRRNYWARSSSRTRRDNTIMINSNIVRACLEDQNSNYDNNNSNSNTYRANELRKLVPGGEAMDMCNLLEESAHYIECLNAQVKLMRGIADFYSDI